VAPLVVREGRWLEGVDSARLWALVADPQRIGEWTPLHFVGYMGKELPEVGNAFFATLGGANPDKAMRFEFTHWEAGRRYRCSVAGPRMIGGLAFSVAVQEEMAESAVSTRLDLELGGDVARVLHPWWRAWAARRLQRAIDAAEAGSP
jgi:hypothetical protein